MSPKRSAMPWIVKKELLGDVVAVIARPQQKSHEISGVAL